MIKQGLTRHDLATATGMSPASISNLIAGNAIGPYGRARIEKLLRIPIWSSHQDFLDRQAVNKVLGFDAQDSSIHRLRRAATAYNLPGRANLHKAELIRLLQAHLLSAESPRKQMAHGANGKRSAR